MTVSLTHDRIADTHQTRRDGASPDARSLLVVQSHVQEGDFNNPRFFLVFLSVNVNAHAGPKLDGPTC